MIIADKIIQFLEQKNVKFVFLVVGGHVMYLNDALFKSKIKPIFCHHEQAAGMAAEAYGRLAGLGVVMVTAGPGCINVLSGVTGAYVDSSPLLVLSGSSTSDMVDYMQKHKIRQYGLQGVNIKPMAESFTKYFVSLRRFSDFTKAYKIAISDRKGPVWCEVPLDIQKKQS